MRNHKSITKKWTVVMYTDDFLNKYPNSMAYWRARFWALPSHSERIVKSTNIVSTMLEFESFEEAKTMVKMLNAWVNPRITQECNQ